MRRSAFKVVVFLLLGAIVNVAVAWGCVIIQRPPMSADIAFFSGDSHEIELAPSQPINKDLHVLSPNERTRLINAGWIPRGELMYEGVGGGWGGGSSRHLTAASINMHGVCVRAITEDELHGCLMYTRECSYQIKVGWPTFSFAGERIATDVESKSWRRIDLVSIPLNPIALHLPAWPLWPGFAINTMFYAGLLWVAFFAPGKMRRMVRRRRGLCPACAYDLRGSTSPVCTECGKEVAGSPLRRSEGV